VLCTLLPLSATYNSRDANNDGVYSRVEFTGAGLRVGAESRWDLPRGFSLYARAAGSLVEGHYGVTQTETNGTATLVNVTDKFDKVVPVTECAVGIGWERNNIRVRLGYEMTNWSNLVDRPDFVNDVSRGKRVQSLSDLSLSGLTVQVGVGF
jgi:Legionella pneumophila major outer membrane protein precursor